MTFIQSKPVFTAEASPHLWHFFLSPAEAWQAMYDDCVKAEASIELEQYIFENDDIGQKFMNLFIEKAAQGVRVFIICDKFGSASFFRSALVKKLRHNGGRFHFFHPITYWTLLTPWNWFPRTHVKTLFVDSKIAYVGGVCIAQRMHNWRDTQVRITGPVTAEVREAFDNIESAISRKKSAKVVGKYRGDEEFAYLQNQPRLERHMVYDRLIKAVGEAKECIYVSTGYFAPNRRFMAALSAAHKRGVDVAILIPAASDFFLMDWLAISCAARLMKRGVRVFQYMPTVLHNKIMMIDDDWATVGSTNMDVLSFFHNRESNLITTNREAVAELKRQFKIDLGNSRELSFDMLRKRPLWAKIGGFLMRGLKSFL